MRIEILSGWHFHAFFSIDKAIADAGRESSSSTLNYFAKR